MIDDIEIVLTSRITKYVPPIIIIIIFTACGTVFWRMQLYIILTCSSWYRGQVFHMCVTFAHAAKGVAQQQPPSLSLRRLWNRSRRTQKLLLSPVLSSVAWRASKRTDALSSNVPLKFCITRPASYSLTIFFNSICLFVFFLFLEKFLWFFFIGIVVYIYGLKWILLLVLWILIERK